MAFVLRHPGKLAAAAFAVLGTSGTVWAFQAIQPGLPVLHFELVPIQYQTKELGTTVDRLVLIDLQARLAKAQADMKAAPNDTTQKTIAALARIIRTPRRVCVRPTRTIVNDF